MHIKSFMEICSSGVPGLLHICESTWKSWFLLLVMARILLANLDAQPQGFVWNHQVWHEPSKYIRIIQSKLKTEMMIK